MPGTLARIAPKDGGRLIFFRRWTGPGPYKIPRSFSILPTLTSHCNPFYLFTTLLLTPNPHLPIPHHAYQALLSQETLTLPNHPALKHGSAGFLFPILGRSPPILILNPALTIYPQANSQFISTENNFN